MTIDLDTPIQPTLDQQRTDQLRTYLTVEAAADVAASTPARPTVLAGRRRLVGGIAAAVVLAAGLFAVNGVVGGPGPASVDPAVAIEQADGWTTISITDPDATPAEIEAALEAVGIEARVVDGDAHSAPQGLSTGGAPAHGTVSFYGLEISTSPASSDENNAFYAVATFEGTETGDLTGLGVDFALPEDFLLSSNERFTISTEPVDTSSADERYDTSDLDAALADLGLKVGGDLPDGTVAIKDGADVEILLYTKA